MKTLKEYNNQFVYVPFNELNIKFFLRTVDQKDEEGEKFHTHDLGFGVLINLNSQAVNSNQGIEGAFPLWVQIIQQEGEVVRRIKVHPNSFIFFQAKCQEIYQKKLANDSTVSKYFINKKDIPTLNKKEENQYTFLEYILPQVEEDQREQLDQFKQQVPIPEESDLVVLTDFSNLQIDYQFRRDKKGEIRTDFNIIRAEVDDVFSQIDVDMAKELRKAFRIDDIIHQVEKISTGGRIITNLLKDLRDIIHKNSSLGAILHGPPGTGKTRAVELTIKKIFEEIFGYNVTVIEMDEITQGGSYYGALMQTVTRIFQKAIKDVQILRPTLLFIDEADRLVENTLRDDDNAGIAALKNYLNPTTYPGIYSCFITNLDKSKINTGIIDRRLEGIYYGYPGLYICSQAWEFHIKTKIFSFDEKEFKSDECRNFNPIFKLSDGTILDSKKAYDSLGKLVAKNVGLDNIDSFCKSYGKKNKTDEINYEQFEIDFYVKTLERLQSKFNETMTSARAENIRLPVSEDDSIKYIQDEYQSSVDRITAALRGEDEDQIREREKEVLIGLNKNGNENIYIQKYEILYDSWIKISNKLNLGEDYSSEINIWKKIYENSKFTFEKLSLVKNKIFRFKDENFFNNLFEPFLNSAFEASKYILSQIDDLTVLKSHPTLIGNKSKNKNSVDIFLVSFSSYIENLKPMNIFILGEIKTMENLDRLITVYANIISRAIKGEGKGITRVAIPVVKELLDFFENYALLYGNKHTSQNIANKKDILNKLIFLYQKPFTDLTQEENNFMLLVENKIISREIFRKANINIKV